MLPVVFGTILSCAQAWVLMVVRMRNGRSIFSGSPTGLNACCCTAEAASRFCTRRSHKGHMCRDKTSLQTPLAPYFNAFGVRRRQTLLDKGAMLGFRSNAASAGIDG